MAFLPALLPTILGVAGSLYSGISAAQQANYRAKVAENNAIQANLAANKAAEGAQIEAQRSDLEYGQLMGQLEAEQGASGLNALGASQIGTRKLLRRTQKTAGMDIRRQGEENSTSYFNDQVNFVGEANSHRAAATSAIVGSVFEAGGQILGNKKISESLLGKAKPRKNYPWSTKA